MSAYNEIIERAEFHFKMTDKQTRESAFWAAAFRWGIPILSAIITAVISGKAVINGVNLKDHEIWFSLLLTIVTLANSIIRPSDIFRSSSKYANQFWIFRTSFKLGYERLEILFVDEKEKMKAQYDYLEQKNQELAKLISDFNGSFLPVEDKT